MAVDAAEVALLVAAFEARVPPKTVIQATNVTPGASSKDSAKLTLAATDVAADFEVFAGVEFDASDEAQLSFAIRGVMLKLLAFKMEADALEAYERYTDSLETKLGQTRHRNRITPKTTSKLEPTSEQAGTRPHFDAEATFVDLIPNASGQRQRIEDAYGRGTP